MEVLQWPGNSPELIENLWNILKNKVAKKQPLSAKQLVDVIKKKVWFIEIAAEYCQTLIHSMPRQLQTVINNKGRHTKYQ